MNLIEIQAEQIEWSERNFGKQHARYPLLGMIEELLEFDAAWDAKQAAYEFEMPPLDVQASLEAEVVDAIGDIAIYMLDYCGKTGQQLNYLWQLRSPLVGATHHWANFAPLARRLAHHQLKGEQGIRGTPESHALAIQDTCRAILAQLEVVCGSMNQDFLAILEKVWSKVRQRNWVANRANAHEVAEQQVIDVSTMAKNNDP